MKTNLLILMMVFISLGGLAQKPQKSPELQKYVSQWNQDDDPYKNFLEKKQNARDHLQKEEQKKSFPTSRIDYGNSNNLKAGMALPSLQMDSVNDFRWNDQTLEWEVFFREWMEYDSLGNNILDAWLGSDGPTFDYGGKWESKWDANGRMIEDTDYDWDFQTKTFLPYQMATYEYDANGYPKVTNQSYWNQNLLTWEPSSTDTFSIDAGGTLLEIVGYEYDTIISDWLAVFRMVSEFDSTGYRNRENQYSWDVTDWTLIGYTDFLADEMGRDTSETSYYDNGSWYEETYKNTRKFDAAGNIIQEAYLIWDGEASFIGNYKYDYTLDGSYVTEEIYSTWDYYWWEWYIYEKTTYARDLNGNLIEETRSFYDTANMVYIPDWKEVYEYDLSTNMSDIAVSTEIKEDLQDNPKLTVINKVTGWTEYQYDTVLMKWDSVEFETFFYSPFGSMAPAQCRADFSFTPDQDPLLIYFSDASGRDAISWYWSFGDGTTSTKKNPQHKYARPGTYSVSLSTIDASGECTNTNVKQIVVGNTLCNAEFTMSVDSVTVTLDNSSVGGQNFFWDFGDGEVSKQMSPTHTYSYPGNYNISLTIQNAAGTCMDRYSLSTRVGAGICNPDFNVFVDSSTNTARFSAVNLNPDNLYRWEFGDGSFETTPKVTKTFTTPGYYSAKLKVSNAQDGCVNTKKANVLIGKKSPGGRADFIYLSGNGNKVQFDDRSLGDNLKYYWNFGNQDTSTMQNPIHDFVLPGYYAVCLTVISPDGSSHTYCEKIFAGEDTQDECLALFEYRLTENQRGISCLDRSLGDPDQWKWTYDDGWSSTDPNPSWSTGSPRHVQLQQTIRNSTTGCRDDAVAIINMGAPGALKAGFGYVIDTSSTKAETYPVDFIGVSLGDAGKLKWDFGDGTYDSTTINPVHYYLVTDTTYRVCLTVTNTTTGEEDMSCEFVSVGSATSVNEPSGLEAGLRSYPNPFSERTRIDIRLHEDTDIDLSLYDLMGRKVKTVARDHRTAGLHILELNASELSAGNYYLILETRSGRSRSILSIVR